MRTKKYLVTFLIIIFFVTSGCARTDEKQIKDVVLHYNNTLILALKSDPEILKEVAVERERGRIQIYMAQMAKENKIINSQLKSIKFKSTKILNDKEWQEIINQYAQKHKQDARVPDEGSLTEFKSGHALVKTEELWSYQYNNARSGKRIGKPESLGYNVTYIIVMEDNRWKVADVLFEEEQVKQQ
jgi:hypothetical protein